MTRDCRLTHPPRGLRVLILAFALALCAVVVARPALAATHQAAAEQTHEQAESEAHDAGWLPLAAKVVNFVLLVGVLVYFLKEPLNGYLVSRTTQIRKDLVDAAATRETAAKQLAEIDARLKALSGELDALRARGAEEMAAEQARIAQAAEADRERLLEQARREIDMRLRIARRQLVEEAAELAVGVAADRLRGALTPEDQARLVDRYADQLRSVRS